MDACRLSTGLNVDLQHSASYGVKRSCHGDTVLTIFTKHVKLNHRGGFHCVLVCQMMIYLHHFRSLLVQLNEPSSQQSTDVCKVNSTREYCISILVLLALKSPN